MAVHRGGAGFKNGKNKNSMRRNLISFLFLGVFLVCGPVPAHTALSAGDVAFLGFTDNAPINDQFAFMILRDVSAGTLVNISDQNWDGTYFTEYDGGVIVWVADKAYPAGTVVQVLPTNNGSASDTTQYAVNIYSAGVTYSNVA